jgi:transglutaminase-like putative cysteine protease
MGVLISRFLARGGRPAPRPNLRPRLRSASAHLAVCFLTFGLLFFSCAKVRHPALARDDAPAWLRPLASAGVPAYDKKVPAVVLLNEQSVKVDDDGRVTTVERYAVRVLTKEGCDEARGSLTYVTGTGKVRDIRAWLIHPSGEVKKYDMGDALDAAAAPNDVFNETRIRMISAEDEAEAGAVFGYEAVTEDRSVFTQFDWQFQDRLPALVSRYALTLPSNWRVAGVTFNHPKIEPTVSGTTHSWELRNLPFIDYEPASPPVTNLAPRLAVSYFPPPGGKAGIGRTFNTWADVSKWLSELSDPQATLNDELASRARKEVEGAKTELEKIQAIGAFVQRVNYISIQTGIGRGGGYRPHSAIEVFTKSYGDCKDKANLMRAMLKAVNIESYLVTIYSGDPTFVREEWPSPQQFNHCIIAVRVGGETDVPTIIRHPTLGRLLVFDPTDDNTPVGDLPDHEQGSLALVVAGEAGALLRMPVTPPEANKLDRQAEVVLDPDGSIKASLSEQSVGQSAADERRQFRARSRPDYVKAIEAWITRGATGASVSKVSPSDNSKEGRFSLDVEFSAARYGQLMQGHLLIFNPAIVSRRESLFLTEPMRKHPVVLEPHAYTETVSVRLPAGFVVDEMPEPSKLDASFGSYVTSYEVKDGRLRFTRKLELRAATIGVDQYATVRSFFERIRAAEQAPVVLARK